MGALITHFVTGRGADAIQVLFGVDLSRGAATLRRRFTPRARPANQGERELSRTEQVHGKHCLGEQEGKGILPARA